MASAAQSIGAIPAGVEAGPIPLPGIAEMFAALMVGAGTPEEGDQGGKAGPDAAPDVLADEGADASVETLDEAAILLPMLDQQRAATPSGKLVQLPVETAAPATVRVEAKRNRPEAVPVLAGAAPSAGPDAGREGEAQPAAAEDTSARVGMAPARRSRLAAQVEETPQILTTSSDAKPIDAKPVEAQAEPVAPKTVRQVGRAAAKIAEAPVAAVAVPATATVALSPDETKVVVAAPAPAPAEALFARGGGESAPAASVGAPSTSLDGKAEPYRTLLRDRVAAKTSTMDARPEPKRVPEGAAGPIAADAREPLPVRSAPIPIDMQVRPQAQPTRGEPVSVAPGIIMEAGTQPVRGGATPVATVNNITPVASTSPAGEGKLDAGAAPIARATPAPAVAQVSVKAEQGVVAAQSAPAVPVAPTVGKAAAPAARTVETAGPEAAVVASEARPIAASPKLRVARYAAAPAAAEPERDAAAPATVSAGAAEARMPVAPLGATQPIAPVSAAPVAASAPPVANALAQQVLDLSRGDAWIDQVARDISQASGKDGTMRFRLAPETLGELRVEITHSERGAHIRLAVSNEQAQQALTAAEPKLAAEARAQGVRIAETEVSLSNGQSQGREPNRQMQEQAQQGQSGQPSQTGRSERGTRAGNPAFTGTAEPDRSRRADRYA